MGNCLKHQSSPKYATDDDDDDWDLLAAEGARFPANNGTASNKVTEVKIKITKKQLEELLGKVDVEELRVEQVLGQLLNRSSGYQAHQRAWRPALQSIPEVN